MPACSCGAAIVWAYAWKRDGTYSAKPLPFDDVPGGPTRGPWVEVPHRHNGTAVVTHAGSDGTAGGRKAHWAACPHAAAHRRG